MLAERCGAELESYLARFREEHDERGHRLVVRNGYHQPTTEAPPHRRTFGPGGRTYTIPF